MKKQSDNLSILKVLGITPQAVFILLLGILVSGMMLGFLVKNSGDVRKKPRPSKSVASKNKVVIGADTIVVGDDGKKDSLPVKKEEVQDKRIPEQKSDSQISGSKRKKQNFVYEENKLPFKKTGSEPVVAIVIDDMGVDMLRTQKMLKVPEIYTVSFLTYAPNLQSQINFAKSAGKEIMLHIPMEAVNNIYDYGPEVLSTKKSRAENLKILSSMLDRVSGYIGVNNHMGSKFTSDFALLSGVIETLGERGLMFLDSKTTPKSQADTIAEYVKLPYISRDVFLDDSNKMEDIEKSLVKLEKIAKKRGYAVAIGHPRDNTINALQSWASSLKSKGIQSVPLSYIIDNFK